MIQNLMSTDSALSDSQSREVCLVAGEITILHFSLGSLVYQGKACEMQGQLAELANGLWRYYFSRAGLSEHWSEMIRSARVC